MDYNSIVFREFTPDSLRRIERYRQEEAERLASERLQRQTIREDDSEPYSSMRTKSKYEQYGPKRKPNKELAVGQTLPRILQTKFPAELIGKPIEEIDWYYRTEYVFVVVNRNKTIFRFSSTPACFLFSPFNCLRRLAIRILTHSLFSTFVMLTILTNCIFMTLKNVPETNEYVFTIIYTLEALAKCVARGFILKKFTFLRDPWNWLDFIVITLAYITFFVNLGNVSVLRTFRVLRALKTVAVVPGLKTIVDALIQSLICLRDVTVLSSFILSIFALVGLQLYMGVLRQKCVPTYDSFLNNSDISSIGHNMSYEAYLKEIDNETHWYQEDDIFVLCGNASGSRRCPKGYVCWKDRGINPDFGYTSFDSYGWAMLSCFRLMTQDYWENLYQLVLTAAGRYHFFYFVAVIFFGSFYLVNLILAIVSMSYQEQQQKVNAENEARERRKVEDELEQQNEEARKASEVDAASAGPVENLQSALFFENPNRQSTHSSLSIEYDHNRLRYNPEHKESMQTAPLVFENYSDMFCNQTTNTDERGSFDTTIPFLDEIQRNSMSTKSHEISPKQRARNWSRISERQHADNESTVTLYQPKSHIKYTPANQLLSHPMSETTSIRSKKQHSVLYKVDRHSDDRHSSHVECRLLLNANEHGRQSQHHPKKRVTIVISDMDSTNTCDRPMIKFLWNFCCEWSCTSQLFHKFQALVADFILDAFVDLFITICIILNTLFMALDQPGQSDKMARILATGNYVFTGIFTAEAILKIIAQAPAKYFKHGWNVFDAIIVTLSVVELGLANVKGLSVLRSFRLLRVFKLAKSWPTLNRLMSIIGKTIGALGNLTLVLVIIIFIFAVMGMQLFGPKYAQKFGKDMPRWNFVDFFHAFMIVFRVLCGEWIESMWTCLECAGWPCVPFFLFTFFIGNLVVLNLFLALLLASFGSNVLSEREKEDDDNKIGEAIDRIQRCIRFILNSIFRLLCRRERKELKIVESLTCETIYFNQSLAGTDDLLHNPSSSTLLDIDNAKDKKNGQLILKDEGAETVEDIEMQLLNTTTNDPSTLLNPTALTNDEELHMPPDCCPKLISKHFASCKDMVPKIIERHWTFLRSKAHRLVEHRFFEWLIIASILASSTTLALEDINTRQQPFLFSILHSFDKLFTIIFTAELVLKWFAYGIKNYFTNGWNWLDFLIVVVSVLGSLLDSLGVADIPAFKSMRTLRALRPLKALSRFEGIRVVVNALIGAIPSIFNVLLVCLVFWLIFSIMGVQLFGGKFYKCVYVDTHDRVNLTENVTNKIDCLHKNFTWENSRVNFDNVLNGYLALFQIATFKGWIEIMADAADSKEVDAQPDHESNVYILVYFVLFIIFGSFFTLNLFIGVVIDNFNQQKRKLGSGGSIEMFMTDDQKKYYNAMKKMGNKKPTKALPRPRFPIARFFFDLTTNQKFDIFIMICIFLNMLCMCLEHHNQSVTYDNVLGYINNFFVAIFTVECGMKLLALHYKYFTIPWNVFDFIIVIASILGQALGELMANYFVNPTLLRVVRVARVGRVLRLVKGAKGIRTLLFALAVSMPALFNIGLLLFLVMFIYSIFGMSFFAYVRKAAGVTEIFNFETFPNSLIILFQMCTTAGWSGVLQALTNDQPPDCDPTLNTPSHRGDCGSMAIAIPFLVSYLIISSLVVVNMYIAVILENFSQAQEDVQQGLTDDDYDMYYEKWQYLDPAGSQFIRYEQLSDFVDELEPPLRIPKPNQLLLVAMDLPICEGDRMHCVDILDGLTKHFLGTLDVSALGTGTNIAMDMRKDRPKDYRPIATTLQRQRDTYLTRIGLRGFRTNVERNRFQRQSRGPVLERATIDELIELDDLGTPTSTMSYRSKIINPDSMPIEQQQQQQRERTPSDTSSSFSFERRSLS
ncbi:unnamed protein product [Rotaria socialis]|uniref:Sodium channel protein n=1 Tax=Rotaria socialis TaxID=392032 RepID=A0A818CH30_9BILA|nr:unnamed protein product [Rotaria socialis]CAF3396281.1 unnamed protein product [Rotaria socialis]CAF3427983.1 unnamed protein product [Rotaria socialis]CAF4249086.1 unnamed protein product [Rotaria socialis]CAF4262040.1 unnamed protein product [Rotaria socialis]